MSTISEMIERAEPGVTYTTGVTVDELFNAWNESGRHASHNIAVNGVWGCDAIEFRLVPKEPYRPSSFSRVCDSDEYTGNVLQVAIALAGLCTVGYVALGWFLS